MRERRRLLGLRERDLARPGRRLLLFSPFIFALGARGAAGPAERPPRVFLWSREDLVRARAALKQGHVPLQPALDRLRRDAEQALEMKAPSVMDKKLTPASGDKHDYFSYGPYLRALFIKHSPDDPANARWRLLYPKTSLPGGTP